MLNPVKHFKHLKYFNKIKSAKTSRILLILIVGRSVVSSVLTSQDSGQPLISLGMFWTYLMKISGRLPPDPGDLTGMLFIATNKFSMRFTYFCQLVSAAGSWTKNGGNTGRAVAILRRVNVHVKLQMYNTAVSFRVNDSFCFSSFYRIPFLEMGRLILVAIVISYCLCLITNSTVYNIYMFIGPETGGNSLHRTMHLTTIHANIYNVHDTGPNNLLLWYQVPDNQTGSVWEFDSEIDLRLRPVNSINCQSDNTCDTTTLSSLDG